MESTDDVISKIKMIGKINPDDKISVRGMYIQKRGLLTTVSRTLINHDNRENTMTFLTTTMKKAFDILSHYNTLYTREKKAGDRLMFTNILNDIKNARVGLFNLKATYESDIMFCCKIETLIQEIDAKLVEYEDCPAIKDE
jgi:hypothetical protein